MKDSNADLGAHSSFTSPPPQNSIHSTSLLASSSDFMDDHDDNHREGETEGLVGVGSKPKQELTFTQTAVKRPRSPTSRSLMDTPSTNTFVSPYSSLRVIHIHVI